MDNFNNVINKFNFQMILNKIHIKFLNKNNFINVHLSIL